MGVARTLNQVWEKTAQRCSHRDALVDLGSGQRWTFEQVDRRVSEEAAGLPVRCSGRRVALPLRNGSEWVIRFLALQQIGATVVPLDSELPHGMRVEDARRWGCVAIWGEESWEVVSSGRVRRGSVALLKFTSGSTGESRALECSPTAMLADGAQVISTMGIRPRDVQLGLIPLGHSYGLGNLVMPLVMQGSTLLLAPSFVPTQLKGWIRAFRPTIFPTVPVILKCLTDLPSIQSLGSLRTVISAGAPLSVEIARGFYQKFRKRIHNFYGSSETGGICYDRNGWAAYTGRGIGTPMNGVHLRLGRDQRVRVRSRAVVTGRREETLSDLGAWNTKGELVLLGRARPVVNVGGRKIDPQEIESRLRGIAGVSEVWVEGMVSGRREILVAAVESEKTEAELRQLLEQRLPAWKIPRWIQVRRQLPRNARGKLDRARIQSLFIFDSK